MSLMPCSQTKKPLDCKENIFLKKTRKNNKFGSMIIRRRIPKINEKAKDMAVIFADKQYCCKKAQNIMKANNCHTGVFRGNRIQRETITCFRCAATFCDGGVNAHQGIILPKVS